MPESLFLNKVKACNFIKKETLAPLFSCEFCEISKNTSSHRTPMVAASKREIINQTLLPPVVCEQQYWSESFETLIYYSKEIPKGMPFLFDCVTQ